METESVTIKIVAISNNKAWQAFFEVVDNEFPDFLPQNLSDLVLPFIKGSYRLDVVQYTPIVTELDEDGEVVQSWDRGKHYDLLLTGPNIKQELRNIKQSAISANMIIKIDYNTPQSLLDYWGSTLIKVWRYTNGSYFMWDGGSLEHNHHEFWGHTHEFEEE